MPLEIGNPFTESEVVVDGRAYRVVADLTTAYRLIVMGELRAQPTDELWKGPFQVHVDRRGLFAKQTSDGYFAIAADPTLAFPDIAANPYSFDVEVVLAGFRPASTTVLAAAGSTFPLSPIALDLYRVPLTLEARAVAAATSHAPIGGALVRSSSTRALVLRTVLHFDHAVGTVVRVCGLNVVGAAKAFDASARSGDPTAVLSNRLGLAPGTVLRFGEPAGFEYGVIDSLAAEPVNPALPGTITLTAPLARSFPAGTVVQPVTPAPQAATAQLDRPVFAGGGVLTLDADLPATQIQIENGGSPELEFHDLGALTDADGYGQLGGIDRPRTLTVAASAPGFENLSQEFSPDFRARVNCLDFRLETP
jgi:hypothetical protein